jgi:hypothetical protein
MMKHKGHVATPNARKESVRRQDKTRPKREREREKEREETRGREKRERRAHFPVLRL